MMRRSLVPLPLIAAVLALAACDTTPVGPGDSADLMTIGAPQEKAMGAQAAGAHGDLLKAVRQATARYNSTTQALRAGYVPDEHCAAHPQLGGMGYHWVNADLVDPVFNALEPEVILYARGSGGNLRLVAVEYIVIDVGQPHPHFAGHPFDVGGVPPLMQAGVPHYSLHVWVHEHNPSGMFAPFNPNVSCD
jgi:hypothetical protein